MNSRMADAHTEIRKYPDRIGCNVGVHDIPFIDDSDSLRKLFNFAMSCFRTILQADASYVVTVSYTHLTLPTTPYV